LSEKVSAHTNAKKIQNLVKLKAIGAEIATVLTGEVFYRPFNNRLQVASYVGLTPSPFQSTPSAVIRASASPAILRPAQL
jgi:transposase